MQARPCFNTMILTDQEQRNVPSASPVIAQEIKYLSEKIQALQMQKDEIYAMRNQSITRNGSILQQGNKQIEGIMMVIQKKIQIVVRETKAIVDHMGVIFDKKLQSAKQATLSNQALTKLQQNYALSIQKAEQHYKQQINTLNKQTSLTQANFLQRIVALQQKYSSKLQQYVNKEKEYVDWIHHLEKQLKEKATKSKKMIEITQQKPYGNSQARRQTQGSQVSAISKEIGSSQQFGNPYQIANSNQVLNSRQIPSLSPSHQQNSKTTSVRKHRIFDAHPIKNQSVTPIKQINDNSPIYNTKIVNPSINQTVNQIVNPTSLPPNRRTDPLPISHSSKNPPQIEPESSVSQWKAIVDHSISQGQITKRNTPLLKEEVNQIQFYKDIPKPNFGWQKFRDIRDQFDGQDDSSGSDDQFFYPQGDKSRSRSKSRGKITEKSNKRQNTMDQPYNYAADRLPLQSNYQSKPLADEKVFSPFDLN